MIKIDALYASLDKIDKQMKVYELIDDDPEMKMKALENMIREFDSIGDGALEGIKNATALLKKIGSDDVAERIEKLTEIN
ncbi:MULTISPECIES: hypothetical protein [Bacillus]|uniref:Uncharacterized protein n=1 Tax=Bacillus pumilus TaxID=1408 RepID=A0AAD0HN11_BACPU|nr:hypothetical protein [Bacillus pumilus]AVM24218.1 hypothetical protein C5695_10340 [Bacillus pumilus]TYS39862.1 hypothetical protein FZC68_18355 [Bacillus pumilus]